MPQKTLQDRVLLSQIAWIVDPPFRRIAGPVHGVVEMEAELLAHGFEFRHLSRSTFCLTAIKHSLRKFLLDNASVAAQCYISMDKKGQNMGNNGAHNITRGPIGKAESRFLARIGAKPAFSSDDAQEILGYKATGTTHRFLARLQNKGWISRIKRDRFAVIPLSSGENRSPQLHEFVVAMELVTPAAIAYWSALNHHGMTEQLPRTVFVATDHPVRRQPGTVLGVSYKVVALRPEKFFGIEQDWIGERPFKITDREKTIIDGLDQPRYVGGIEEIVKALSGAWTQLDETKLRTYAAKIGNGAAAKRLGFIMEALGIGDAASFHEGVQLAPGYSPLDPTLPRRGKHNRRWGLLVNTEVTR